MYDPYKIWSEFWNGEEESPIVPKNHPQYNLLYGGTKL